MEVLKSSLANTRIPLNVPRILLQKALLLAKAVLLAWMVALTIAGWLCARDARNIRR